MAAVLSDLGVSDLADVLALNQAHVPHVGSLDEARLTDILAEASLALGARDELGELGGFVLVLGPGAVYDSPNYQWFAQRYDDFRYVDRWPCAPPPIVADSGVSSTRRCSITPAAQLRRW